MSTLTRRDDGKTYSVFLAGATDCDPLRLTARGCFDVFEPRGSSVPPKFSVFDWKEHKSPGHTVGKFQDQVFRDAELRWGKSDCDIFVMFLWHKFGQDTKREYDYYVGSPASGPAAQLFVCHYNAPVEPLSLLESKIDQLFKWIEKPRRDWAEIRPERGTVTNSQLFQQALSKQINLFLSDPS